MCRCKKAMRYTFWLKRRARMPEQPTTPAPHWHVKLDGQCTRCGEVARLKERAVRDIPGDDTATELDVQLAMVALLPKGISLDDIGVSYE